jgi:hypothetical protein
MVDESGLWSAACNSHFERVDNELCAEVVAHRPANDAAREAVDDSGQIQPAGRGRHVFDVGDPELICGRRRRLEDALGDLNAQREDGRELLFDEQSLEPVISLRSDAGELKIVPEPEGTRGYDDLRRAATREPLGQGVRPSVASLGDLARMLGARGREVDLENLRMLRRVIALERSRGLSRER